MSQPEPIVSMIESPTELDPAASAAVLETDIAENIVSNRFQDVTSCFCSTFITIFLAEIGDKTQIATLLMSAQSHKPIIVFIGAATALIATSLVGVLLGRWLSQVLQPRTLERVTGMILAVVSVLLFIDVAGA